MNGEVLTLMELDDKTGRIAEVSYELLEAGRRLSNGTGERLSAALMGHRVLQHLDEIVRYVDKVYVIDSEFFKIPNIEFHVCALEKICNESKPGYILISHTCKGVDVGVRLSARLKVPLTTDCIDLELDPQKRLLLRKKQIYGGNVLATFTYNVEPQLVTLRPKTWNKISEAKKEKGEIVKLDLNLETPCMQRLTGVRFVKIVKENTVKLDDAEVIIAGGRGLGGPEGFRELEKLKRLLERFFGKVEIGASRPPVDKGWASPIRQIGLTGEKVSPTLYVAVGISGATQHIVGIDQSKIIAAINTDPKAPIFSVADLGAVGDYKQVLSGLIRKLEEAL